MKTYTHGAILVLLSSQILVCLSKKDPTPRQFSLFSIVSFKQQECSAVSTTDLKGTCMTATECSSQSGGVADGNCAAAFGVCCVVSVSTCGSSITQNCSYIENPSYPGTWSTTGDCAYTVTRCQDDICQIRLDFLAATLQQPSTVGVCTNMQLIIASGSTSQSFTTNPPQLCGTLTGQHLYVDSGRASSAATITFSIDTAAANSWRVKVTQIECWNPSKAPEGCLQYLYGANRHTVKSFNWDGSTACSSGCMLHDLEYQTCFRPEKGMCGQSFTPTIVSTGKDAFQLGNEAEVAEIGRDGECAESYLVINSIEVVAVSHRDGVFCGDHLNFAEDATDSGTIEAQTSNPFQFMTVAQETLDAGTAGYSLDVQQLACSPSNYGGFGGNA